MGQPRVVRLSGIHSGGPGLSGSTELELRCFRDRTEFWLSGDFDGPWGPKLVDSLPGRFDWRRVLDRFNSDTSCPAAFGFGISIEGIEGAAAELLKMAWCSEGDTRPVAVALASCSNQQLRDIAGNPGWLSSQECQRRIEAIGGRLEDLGQSKEELGSVLRAVCGTQPASLSALEDAIAGWERAADEEEERRRQLREATLKPFARRIEALERVWKMHNASRIWPTELTKAIEDFVIENGRMPTGTLTLSYRRSMFNSATGSFDLDALRRLVRDSEEE